MAIGIIGKKLGMTQVFGENGIVIPVTVVKAGPCVVVQKKTVEHDGYNAVQVGFNEITKLSKVNKPLAGHFKKAEVPPMARLKEFRVDEEELNGYEKGSAVPLEPLRGRRFCRCHRGLHRKRQRRRDKEAQILGRAGGSRHA